MAGLIDLYGLRHDEIIDLYRVDLSAIGGTNLYFCNYAKGNIAIVWNGITYTPTPLEATGWEMSGRGVGASPRIVFNNLFGEFSALCRQYRDMVGATLYRYQLYVSDLDVVNSAPLRPPEVWRGDRKITENALTVAFELDNSLNMEGSKIPGRRLLANTCSWLIYGGFKGSYCQYTGTAATCDGRLVTCRDLGNAARYGGAPGVDNQRNG